MTMVSSGTAVVYRGGTRIVIPPPTPNTTTSNNDSSSSSFSLEHRGSLNKGSQKPFHGTPIESIPSTTEVSGGEGNNHQEDEEQLKQEQHIDQSQQVEADEKEGRDKQEQQQQEDSCSVQNETQQQHEEDRVKQDDNNENEEEQLRTAVTVASDVDKNVHQEEVPEGTQDDATAVESDSQGEDQQEDAASEKQETVKQETDLKSVNSEKKKKKKKRSSITEKGADDSSTRRRKSGDKKGKKKKSSRKRTSSEDSLISFVLEENEGVIERTESRDSHESNQQKKLQEKGEEEKTSKKKKKKRQSEVASAIEDVQNEDEAVSVELQQAGDSQQSLGELCDRSAASSIGKSPRKKKKKKVKSKSFTSQSSQEGLISCDGTQQSGSKETSSKGKKKKHNSKKDQAEQDKADNKKVSADLEHGDDDTPSSPPGSVPSEKKKSSRPGFSRRASQERLLSGMNEKERKPLVRSRSSLSRGKKKGSLKDDLETPHETKSLGEVDNQESRLSVTFKEAIKEEESFVNGDSRTSLLSTGGRFKRRMDDYRKSKSRFSNARDSTFNPTSDRLLLVMNEMFADGEDMDEDEFADIVEKQTEQLLNQQLKEREEEQQKQQTSSPQSSLTQLEEDRVEELEQELRLEKERVEELTNTVRELSVEKAHVKTLEKEIEALKVEKDRVSELEEEIEELKQEKDLVDELKSRIQELKKLTNNQGKEGPSSPANTTSVSPAADQQAERARALESENEALRKELLQMKEKLTRQSSESSSWVKTYNNGSDGSLSMKNVRRRKGSSDEGDGMKVTTSSHEVGSKNVRDEQQASDDHYEDYGESYEEGYDEYYDEHYGNDNGTQEYYQRCWDYSEHVVNSGHLSNNNHRRFDDVDMDGDEFADDCEDQVEKDDEFVIDEEAVKVLHKEMEEKGLSPIITFSTKIKPSTATVSSDLEDLVEEADDDNNDENATEKDNESRLSNISYNDQTFLWDLQYQVNNRKKNRREELMEEALEAYEKHKKATNMKGDDKELLRKFYDEKLEENKTKQKQEDQWLARKIAQVKATLLTPDGKLRSSLETDDDNTTEKKRMSKADQKIFYEILSQFRKEKLAKSCGDNDDDSSEDDSSSSDDDTADDTDVCEPWENAEAMKALRALHCSKRKVDYNALVKEVKSANIAGDCLATEVIDLGAKVKEKEEKLSAIHQEEVEPLQKQINTLRRLIQQKDQTIGGMQNELVSLRKQHDTAEEHIRGLEDEFGREKYESQRSMLLDEIRIEVPFTSYYDEESDTELSDYEEDEDEDDDATQVTSADDGNNTKEAGLKPQKFRQKANRIRQRPPSNRSKPQSNKELRQTFWQKVKQRTQKMASGFKAKRAVIDSADNPPVRTTNTSNMTVTKPKMMRTITEEVLPEVDPGHPEFDSSKFSSDSDDSASRYKISISDPESAESVDLDISFTDTDVKAGTEVNAVADVNADTVVDVVNRDYIKADGAVGEHIDTDANDFDGKHYKFERWH